MDADNTLNFAQPKGLFNYYKEQVRAASNQNELDLIRQSMIYQTLKHKDQLNEWLGAIQSIDALIDHKIQHVPRIDEKLSRELLGQGLFCFIGTTLIILSIISTFFIAFLSIAYVLIGLAIGYTIKDLIENFDSLKKLSCDTELGKIILGFTVTLEIFFHLFAEINETSLLLIGGATLGCSLFVIYLAYKTYQDYKQYTLINNNNLESIIKLESNSDSNPTLNNNFTSLNPYVNSLDSKIIHLLNLIAGQNTSQELSEACLNEIDRLLQNKDNHAFLYELIKLETRLLQAEQPSIKAMPKRLIADAALTISTVSMHIIIGFTTLASFLIWPIFAIGLISLILFAYNEYNDTYTRNFLIGTTSTSIALTFMTIAFLSMMGLSIGFNPFLFGLGLIIVIPIVLYCIKRYNLDANNHKAIQLAGQINQNEPDPLHPDLHARLSIELSHDDEHTAKTKEKETFQSSDEHSEVTTQASESGSENIDGQRQDNSDSESEDDSDSEGEGDSDNEGEGDSDSEGEQNLHH